MKIRFVAMEYCILSIRISFSFKFNFAFGTFLETLLVSGSQVKWMATVKIKVLGSHLFVIFSQFTIPMVLNHRQRFLQKESARGKRPSVGGVFWRRWRFPIYRDGDEIASNLRNSSSQRDGCIKLFEFFMGLIVRGYLRRRFFRKVSIRVKFVKRRVSSSVGGDDLIPSLVAVADSKVSNFIGDLVNFLLRNLSCTVYAEKRSSFKDLRGDP